MYLVSVIVAASVPYLIMLTSELPPQVTVSCELVMCLWAAHTAALQFGVLGVTLDTMARQKQFPCSLWTIGSPLPCSPTRRWAKRFAAASAWGHPLIKAERRDRDNLTHIGVASSIDLLFQVSSILKVFAFSIFSRSFSCNQWVYWTYSTLLVPKVPSRMLMLVIVSMGILLIS